MELQPIRPIARPSAADASDRILALLSADVEPGGRLPPERSIATALGLSRAEIRKTLARLEAEGRIARHVGRGTFLIGETPVAADSLSARTSPREAMQARLLLEPELAGLAAVNATAEQLSELRSLAAAARRVTDWAGYETLDAQFHRKIAEAAGNTLLLAVHDIVNEVRRAVIWSWLDTRPAGPPPDYSSFAEHDAILDAIVRRDRSRATEAMRAHLRTTSGRLIGVD